MASFFLANGDYVHSTSEGFFNVGPTFYNIDAELVNNKRIELEKTASNIVLHNHTTYTTTSVVDQITLPNDFIIPLNGTYYRFNTMTPNTNAQGLFNFLNTKFQTPPKLEIIKYNPNVHGNIALTGMFTTRAYSQTGTVVAPTTTTRRRGTTA